MGGFVDVQQKSGRKDWKAGIGERLPALSFFGRCRGKFVWKLDIFLLPCYTVGKKTRVQKGMI